MSEESGVIAKYREIIEELFGTSSKYIYHNLDHTRAVVGAFKDIGEASGLSVRELELGTIAAWFHDVGFTKGGSQHEEKSIEILLESVDQDDFSEKELEIMKNLILATKMPQNPKSTLEKCLCDADLHHLGTSNYFESSEQLRQEWSIIYGIEMNKESWKIESYLFLNNHQYHTPFAQEKYNAVKAENIIQLQSKIKEFDKRDKQIKKLESKLEKLNDKLVQKPSRGIETMFRTTARNHLALSGMADSKANIMISVNTIVISVIMSFGGSRIAEYPYLLMPMTLLVLVCLTTIVLSILATRPKVTKGTFTRDDILNKKTNLLFFGNFHGMELDDFQWGMNMLMNDADYLYNSMSRDLFFLGKVLGTKYRMLRAAYTTFMIGFVVSILFLIYAAFKNSTVF